MMMQPVASPMRIAAPARLTAALMLLASLGACTALAAAPRAMPPADEVRVREQAFARTMADRDFEAFATFVADDAVFLNGGRPLRGKAAVLAHWQRFFDTADAPFSWTPDLVEALPDGRLAHSEGPVSGVNVERSVSDGSSLPALARRATETLVDRSTLRRS